MLNFQDGRAIRTVGPLDTCAHVRAHAVIVWLSCDFIYAPDELGWRGVIYGLRTLRTDSKFHFCGEHQLHRKSPTSAVFMGWAAGLGACRNPESLRSA